MAKGNTSSGLVPFQQTDGATIGEDQIRKIQDKDATSRLGIDSLAQLAHIVGVKFTADREHNPSAARATNSKHRSSRCNAIARPFGSSLNVRRLADEARRDFANGEMRDNTNLKAALAFACESGSY